MVFVRKAQNRNRENIARLLRRHGITPTHQRIEIAYVLFKRREHLSADQILKWVIVYDPNTEPHHHLYDVVTGRLTDVPADNIRVLGLPPLPQGTVADGVDIIIRTRPQS